MTVLWMPKDLQHLCTDIAVENPIQRVMRTVRIVSASVSPAYLNAMLCIKQKVIVLIFPRCAFFSNLIHKWDMPVFFLTQYV